ncbi:hypothetical protein C8N46_10855 [Kordia periserrulae]|uniref:YhhN-like protein n=1 Tax=Kordia periserrulae TaxID=701523 RepID=A0A2T6BUJ9_9FLAO|nr:hypothetical protein [Kordia periserrulae]PTX59745.1 hypothetical protein C8N46_10855 [Kordia periserrulae]
MNLTKPTHIAFVIASALTILVAIFMEKFSLIYIQPLTVIAISIIYFTERKGAINILYVLAQIIFLVGGILLILGMREHLRKVCVIFSLFYIIYLRLMYVRNAKKKAELRTYFHVTILAIPMLYIYYLLVQVIAPELKHVVIYFSVLMFFMLSYVITALYYYLKDKKPTNLWMLIAAINLGFMNILIGLNELYMYETIFTVIIAICSLCMQFFLLKFMLHDDKEDNVLNTTSE